MGSHYIEIVAALFFVTDLAGLDRVVFGVDNISEGIRE